MLTRHTTHSALSNTALMFEKCDYKKTIIPLLISDFQRSTHISHFLKLLEFWLGQRMTQATSSNQAQQCIPFDWIRALWPSFAAVRTRLRWKSSERWRQVRITCPLIWSECIHVANAQTMWSYAHASLRTRASDEISTNSTLCVVIFQHAVATAIRMLSGWILGTWVITFVNIGAEREIGLIAFTVRKYSCE